MFRRSVPLFLGFALLVLLLVVGYALTGLSGPDKAIDEAEAALAAGQPDEAVRLLRLAETSLGAAEQNDLRRRHLLLRYRARLDLHNTKGALADLRTLTDKYARGDQDLVRQYIRVLIANGESERALDRALKQLGDVPENSRTLELAGEASQAIYQEKLRALFDDLSTKISAATFREAVQALLPYLYRNDDDPLARLGKARFDEILRSARREDYVAKVYDNRIEEVRDGIAQAQRYYRRSLEAPGTPVSAFRGFAYALEQGRRDDDVLGLAEVYLRRFDHVFAVQAAISAARVHLGAKRYHAVIELTDRFLPPDRWQQLATAGRIDSDIRHLLLAKARALYALRDADRLRELNAQVNQMASTGDLALAPERYLIDAYHKDLAGDGAAVEHALRPFVQHPTVRAQPTIGHDDFVEAMRMRVAGSEAAGAPMSQFEWQLKTWMDHRPNDPEPYLHRARLRIKFGQAEAALIDATTGYELAGHDEDALRVYAEASDLAFAPSGRDSRALLTQCLTLGSPLPRAAVANNVMYLMLARRAMEEEQYTVALAAAQRATTLFNWARWPRYLLADAAMKLGSFQRAVQAMETLLAYHPGDERGLRTLRAARKAAGQPIDDLLYELALSGLGDSDLAHGLLANCLQRGDWQSARRFAAQIGPAYGRDVDILVQVADAYAGAGDPTAAARILTPLAQRLIPLRTPAAKKVAERYLALRAKNTHETALRTLALAARTLHEGDDEALYRMARGLWGGNHYAAAYDMLQPILEGAQSTTQRSGAFYLLAGELALHLGLFEEAETHYNAALSFADGAAASHPLALLLVLENKIAQAQDAYWEDRAHDLASAALLLRLGRPAAAARWVRAAHAREPAMLATAGLMAILDPAASVHPAAQQLARAAPELLLDTLMFTEVAGFRSRGLLFAKQLRDQFPANVAAAFLHAHALAETGVTNAALAQLGPLAEDQGLIAAYDEILRVLHVTEPEAATAPALIAKIQAAVHDNPGTATPRIRAALLQAEVRDRVSGTSHPQPETLDRLAQLWTEYPEETRAGVLECAALIHFGRCTAALDLFDHLEGKVPSGARVEFIAQIAKHGTAIAHAAGPVVLARLERRVLDMLETDGPFGGLVHLLLEIHQRKWGPVPQRRDEAALNRLTTERQLLDAHLEFFRKRRDPDVAALRRSLERLQEIVGTDATLERVESLLDSDPSLVSLWLLRARLLEQNGQPGEGVRGLRWMFHYINAPEVLVETCRIAGQAGISTPDDEARLLRDLDAQSAKTPRAALARGLMALRMARYEEAADILKNAERRPDGAHLFYAALANLPLRDPAATTHAAELLREFEASYPDSRVCEIADHLATQLTLVEAAPPRAK